MKKVFFQWKKHKKWFSTESTCFTIEILHRCYDIRWKLSYFFVLTIRNSKLKIKPSSKAIAISAKTISKIKSDYIFRSGVSRCWLDQSLEQQTCSSCIRMWVKYFIAPAKKEEKSKTKVAELLVYLFSHDGISNHRTCGAAWSAVTVHLCAQ